MAELVQRLTHASDRHAARVALIALLSAEERGIQLILNTLGDALPDAVVSDLASYQLARERLVKTINSGVGEQ